MQILNKSFYDEKLNSSTTYTVTTSNPRGEIYDAAGNLLVSNTVKQVVAFTRSNTITAEEMKELAAKIINSSDFYRDKCYDASEKRLLFGGLRYLCSSGQELA